MAPTVAVALFGIWAVHKLTKSREREKAVFEIYKTLSDHVDAMKEAAMKAWSLPKGPERRRALAETKWRLQQVGGGAERLRKMSKRKKWSWQWGLRRDVSIKLTSEMKELRDAITVDPFEDPERRADRRVTEVVEQAVGGFLSSLDEKFFNWMR